MDSLPIHMRISHLSPSNEDVDSRKKAIMQLSSAWNKYNATAKIVGKVAEISIALGGDGTPPEALSSEVERVVQKNASAFLSSERPLEVGVCAGMAALSIMSANLGTKGWTTVDLYSNALWSALAFQPVLQEEKREALRREVLDRARERSLESAIKARERELVPEVPDLNITVDAELHSKTNFKNVVAELIDPLRRNAVLDREELDYLWWAQINQSRVLRRPLHEISEPTRLVTLGVEGAGLLRRLPADVHREIILRTIDADPELTLRELVEEIGQDCAALVKRVPNVVTSEPTVFPLLNALVTGTVAGDGAAEKRKASTWGSRALLETTLARFLSEGVALL
mgnify:FL=1